MNNDFNERKLPEGVSEEDVEALVERVQKEFEALGLYGIGGVTCESRGDTLVLVAHFEVGQLAFSKRVQDPEQDSIDDAFRPFEEEAIRDEIAGILEDHQPRGDDDGESSSDH